MEANSTSFFTKLVGAPKKMFDYIKSNRLFIGQQTNTHAHTKSFLQNTPKSSNQNLEMSKENADLMLRKGLKCKICLVDSLHLTRAGCVTGYLLETCWMNLFELRS